MGGSTWPSAGLTKQYWAQGLLNETSECDGAELKNKGTLAMMMVMVVVVVVMLMAMVMVMMLISVTAQNTKTKEHLQSIPRISCG